MSHNLFALILFVTFDESTISICNMTPSLAILFIHIIAMKTRQSKFQHFFKCFFSNDN